MGYDGHGRFWTMSDGMGRGGWVMMILLALLCFAVFAGFLYAMLHATRSGTVADGRQAAAPRRPSAQDTLDDRLARGEIDVEEYQQRTRALRGD